MDLQRMKSEFNIIKFSAASIVTYLNVKFGMVIRASSANLLELYSQIAIFAGMRMYTIDGMYHLCTRDNIFKRKVVEVLLGQDRVTITMHCCDIFLGDDHYSRSSVIMPTNLFSLPCLDCNMYPHGCLVLSSTPIVFENDKWPIPVESSVHMIFSANGFTNYDIHYYQFIYLVAQYVGLIRRRGFSKLRTKLLKTREYDAVFRWFKNGEDLCIYNARKKNSVDTGTHIISIKSGLMQLGLNTDGYSTYKSYKWDYF